MANLNSREMAKIAINKKLCREYCDASKGADNFIVYLNDGDEFQIQLFNPTDRVIGAKIEFNNEHKGWVSSDNYIVLRPGERVWLERFLDCHDKFIFNTYEVSNSSQVLEAIKDNGDITVRFYYEDTNKSRGTGITVSSPMKLYYTEPYDHTYYCEDSVNCFSSATTLGMADVASTLTSSLKCAATTCDSASTSYSYTGSITDSNVKYGTNSCVSKGFGKTKLSASASTPRSIETGRVERGSYSNQNFKNVYYDFQSWAFATKHFKLLPVSRKQYSDSDLKKVYCTNCGKKLSPKFKFCPVCGTKVTD